jgi:hypothetical protein
MANTHIKNIIFLALIRSHTTCQQEQFFVPKVTLWDDFGVLAPLGYSTIDLLQKFP